jgi:hypothetical protein
VPNLSGGPHDRDGARDGAAADEQQ